MVSYQFQNIRNQVVALALGLSVGIQAFGAEEAKKECNPTTKVDVQVQKVDGQDGDEPSLVAEVKRGGAALANVAVEFSVPRLFGKLPLGVVETDEAGKASMKFPVDLPGDAKSGELKVTAKIVNHEVYMGEAQANMPGGTQLQIVADPFPRAIWSPKTDWYLLLTIPTLIGCVWSVYIFSLRQLFRVWKLK